MLNEITLIIEAQGGHLLWADFDTAVRESIGAIKAVGASLADQERLAGSWRIERLSMDSPASVALAYESDTPAPPRDWLPTFTRGMRQLEQGEERPSGFPVEAIDHLARLAGMGDRVRSIRYQIAGEEPVSVSMQAAEHATAIKNAQSRTYSSFGELRGELGQITVHGNTHEFAIWDPLTDHRIPCTFSANEPTEVAKDITRRVVVYGKITYNKKTNDPVRVDVESYDVLRTDDELSPLSEIGGAMRSLPEGQSSEDYIREQRDAE